MGYNKKSLENLKRIKKGERRNPAGRPKAIPELRELLADILSQENDAGISAAKGILIALRNKALRGDVRAAELLLDRQFGKSITQVELSGKNGGDIKQAHTMTVEIIETSVPLAASEERIHD